jgi:uncharacterized protein involved in propanediol utilization
MLSVTGDNRVHERADLIARRDDLKQAIAVLLEESLTEKGRAGNSTLTAKACAYHGELVREVLKSDDVIISFNCDCVIDYALAQHGAGKRRSLFTSSSIAAMSCCRGSDGSCLFQLSAIDSST